MSNTLLQDALVDILRQEIHRLGGTLQNLSIASNSHIPSPPRSPTDPSAPTALSITIPPNAAVTNAIGAVVFAALCRKADTFQVPDQLSRFNHYGTYAP